MPTVDQEGGGPTPARCAAAAVHFAGVPGSRRAVAERSHGSAFEGSRWHEYVSDSSELSRSTAHGWPPSLTRSLSGAQQWGLVHQEIIGHLIDSAANNHARFGASAGN